MASESPDPKANKGEPSPVPIPDITPPIPALETLEELRSKCLGPDTHTCLLALLPSKADQEVELPLQTISGLASLADLAQKHQKRGDHLFPFYSVPASNSGGEMLAAALSLPIPEDMLLVAVNGKRSWYRVYDQVTKAGFSSSSVEDWVDGIRLGEGQKHKLPQDLFLTATSAPEGEATPPGSSGASASSPKETSITVHEEL